MVLKSMSSVPMNDGTYFGKITGELVDAKVHIEDDIVINVSFPVDGEVNGKDVPAVIVVKDSYAVVHLED
jgi:hypothetical protein